MMIIKNCSRLKTFYEEDYRNTVIIDISLGSDHWSMEKIANEGILQMKVKN